MNRTVESSRVTGIATLAFSLSLVFALIQGEALWLLLSVFGLLWVGVSNVILKRLGTQISLTETGKKRRYHIDNEGAFEFTIRNDGLPIYQATLIIQFDNNVNPIDVEKTTSSGEGIHEVRTRITLGYRSEKTIHIPFVAFERGIGRIRSIRIDIPNWAGFGHVELRYYHTLKQEALVFPKLLPVAETEKPLTQFEGDFPKPFALFQDRMLPVSVRDYQFGDDFKDIHWKASAKMQKLQTKQYETITDQSVLLTVNITSDYGLSKDLDALVEHSAFIANEVLGDDMAFGLAMNRMTFGSFRFMHTQAGTGNEQLLYLLEQLASVTKGRTLTTSYTKLLSHLIYQRERPVHWIHAGERTQEVDEMLHHLHRNGQPLSILHLHKETAYLSPYTPLEQRGRDHGS
ncbi:DUF58 domain-containing protein [Geomicrobium sp. JSM 1781026]|uniref:DUF58 domain-containing protein n=1 Tax=Geomicrobium sp. JSM 1781026 TaxID=3344580 RepID=UPI0035C25B19